MPHRAGGLDTHCARSAANEKNDFPEMGKSLKGIYFHGHRTAVAVPATAAAGIGHKPDYSAVSG